MSDKNATMSIKEQVRAVMTNGEVYEARQIVKLVADEFHAGKVSARLRNSVSTELSTAYKHGEMWRVQQGYKAYKYRLDSKDELRKNALLKQVQKLELQLKRNKARRKNLVACMRSLNARLYSELAK